MTARFSRVSLDFFVYGIWEFYWGLLWTIVKEILQLFEPCFNISCFFSLYFYNNECVLSFVDKNQIEGAIFKILRQNLWLSKALQFIIMVANSFGS